MSIIITKQNYRLLATVRIGTRGSISLSKNRKASTDIPRADGQEPEERVPAQNLLNIAPIALIVCIRILSMHQVDRAALF